MSNTKFIIYEKLHKDYLRDSDSVFVLFDSEEAAYNHAIDEMQLEDGEFEIETHDYKKPKWLLEEERGEQMWERLHDSEDFHYPDRD